MLVVSISLDGDMKTRMHKLKTLYIMSNRKCHSSDMFRIEAHQEMSEATKNRIKCIKSIQITSNMQIEKISLWIISNFVYIKEIVPSWRRREKRVNENPLQMRAKNQNWTTFGQKRISH